MKNKFLKGLVASFVLAVSNLANAGLISSDEYELTQLDNLWTYGYTDWNAMSEYGNFGNVEAERLKIESLLSDGYTANSDIGSFNYNGVYSWDYTQNASPDYYLTFLFDSVFNFDSVEIITSRLISNNMVIEAFTNNSWAQVASTGSCCYSSTGTTENFNLSNVQSNMLRVKVGKNTSLHEFSVYGSSVAVPEPSTLAVFALGLMGLASRKFKKQA